MKKLSVLAFFFTSSLISFQSLAIEQDLFESASLDIPNSLPDELEFTRNNNSNLLPFDEDILLQGYSDIDFGRELIQNRKPSKSKTYVPNDARRVLISTNRIITELAVLGFPQIWTNDNGLSRKGRDLVDFIKKSYMHGFYPSDYALKIIQSDLPSDEIEIAASKAFVDLTNDIMLGRLDASRADTDWYIRQDDRIALNEILSQALYSNDIKSLLNNKLPQSSIYVSLSRKLRKLRNTPNGWTSFPPKGPRLKAGSKHGDVIKLRKRLATSGFLKSSKGGKTFTKSLKRALIKFQSVHGLNRSGVVTKATRRALAASIESRIVQLEQSLERIRWLPNFMPDKYIFVNTAGSELNMRENNSTILNMRTVVGQRRKSDDENTETPSFSKKMKHIIINPEWYVPASIITSEFVPKAKEDVKFFELNNYTVYDPTGTIPIDPTSINWHQYEEGQKVPYQVRQAVGDTNALGRVKFMFPNRHSIYLHDTPSKSLFRHERRTYSHGCVRLARPFDLASTILQTSAKEIKRVRDTGEKTKIILDDQISVFIAYITAWARDDGTVVFYEDNYGFDKRMKNNFP